MRRASKLCRFVKDSVLWSCLVGMTVHAKHLNTAEVAYAAINQMINIDMINQKIEKEYKRER